MSNSNGLPAMSQPSIRKEWRTGWRFGLFWGAVGTLFTFVMNIVGLAIALSKPAASELDIGTEEADSSLRVLYEGPCSTAKYLNVFLHLAINILSTLLLGVCNYCMQCLSAPTREDIDRAHRSGIWLDIGVFSVRNLRRISKLKTSLWVLIGLCSIPLLLLYNSVIFSSITAYRYSILGVNESFVEKSFFTSRYYEPKNKAIMTRLHQLARTNQLENLTNAECISEYAYAYQTKRSNLVIVSHPEQDDTEDILYLGSQSPASGWGNGCALDAFGWICPDATCAKPCRKLLPEVMSNLSNWYPVTGKRAARYCLSEKMDERCRLNYSVWIAVGVLATNMLITIAVFTVLFKLSKSTPILTIGDAMVSFLTQPDPPTKNRCLLSRDRVSQRIEHSSVHPEHYVSTPRRFYAVASRGHWISAVLLYVLAIGVMCSLLAYGLTRLPGGVNVSTLWSIGLGTIHEYNVLELALGYYVPQAESKGLIDYILVANMPQLIMSLLYFSYNNLFTRMMSAVEWNKFAHERKGVRVSSMPKGAQRSRYFLQLPYRISVPLLIVSTAMHWLISQSLFVVAVQTFATGEQSVFRGWTLLACGYSPIAILLVIILACGLVVALLVTGSRRFRSGMPVAATSSMAIAAACHSSGDASTSITAEKPLQWGVMGIVHHDGEVYAHCGFSADPGTEPEQNTLYL